MIIDFASRRVTLVVTPIDLRQGFNRREQIARLELGIDSRQEQDFVVFISKNRALCKVIACDSKGTVLISRRLHRGRFEQLLLRVDCPAMQPLTADELAQFLDGEPLRVKRVNLQYG